MTEMKTLSRALRGSVAIIVFVALAAGAFGGCGSSSTTDDTDDTETDGSTDGNIYSAPTDGLEFWLDADAITGLSDGEDVATWSDSSASGNNATQGDPGRRPTYHTGVINSRPVVRFVTGEGDWLDLSDGSVVAVDQPVSAFDVFAVIKPVLVDDAYQTLVGFGVSGDELLLGAFDNYILGYFDEDYIGTTLISDSAFSLVHYSLSGTSITYRVNGTAETAQTISALTMGSNGGRKIGGDGSSLEAFRGDLAEILYYSRSLTDEERTSTNCYLSEKYALDIAGC